jgi:hypothetical protein
MNDIFSAGTLSLQPVKTDFESLELGSTKKTPRGCADVSKKTKKCLVFSLRKVCIDVQQRNSCTPLIFE